VLSLCLSGRKGREGGRICSAVEEQTKQRKKRRLLIDNGIYFLG
jgi:hypothetical protein